MIRVALDCVISSFLKVQRGNVKREHGKEPKTVEFNSRSSVNVS